MLITRIEIVEQLVHAAMQADVGSEVLQQTEEPLMLLVTLLAFPDGGSSEHRTALREEVEHQQVAHPHVVDHGRTRILRPSLHHPDGLRVDALHCCHHRLASLGIVDGCIVMALVEGVHRVVVGLAEKLRQLIIIQSGNLSKARIGWHEIGRALETVPQSGISHVQV